MRQVMQQGFTTAEVMQFLVLCALVVYSYFLSPWRVTKDLKRDR